ncbi:MAG: hypothetical protein HZA50_02225 [Planctomycetes bacterium]|nr:hypothetical protein [Planctomycetota bacterium]
MNTVKLIVSVVATIGAFLSAGCEAIPASGPVSVSAVSPQRDAGLFWSSHSMGSICKTHGRRVAIAQFTVEFVTERIEPAKRGDPDLAARHFVTVAADFGEGLKMELPGMLCELMRQKEDIQFAPIHEVSAGKAYAKFKGLEMGQKIGVKRPEDSTSDCGRPLCLSVYTVDGLRIIDADQPDIEEIMMELLDELKVDAVLRVRLRVGVFAGRATIEDESSIEAFGRNYFGNLESTRTLIGEKLVADCQSRPKAGRIVYHVNSAKYCCEVKELFLKYMAMAAVVSGNK